MSNAELTWSMDDHIRYGETVIAEILAMEIETKDSRVCFHLTPMDFDDSEPWNEEASYNLRAKPLFNALGLPLDIDYVGGTSGIEACETVVPSIDWLHLRVPAIIDIAHRAGLNFDGRSIDPLKPSDASFLSCGPTLDVVNQSSPEGQAAIDELMASNEASKAAEQ